MGVFAEHDLPIGAVCHAPAIFKHPKLGGKSLVAGRKVTGFTNTEEEGVGLTDVVPFLVEDMLKANGGVYLKGDDWASFVTSDGKLVTGQNPAQRSCLGAVTATGCGALCPSAGRACYGCYGLSDNPNPHALALRFEGFGLVGSEIAQRLLMIHSNEKINRQEADNWVGSDHD